MCFFLMIRRPPRSTLFPYRRSSDLERGDDLPDDPGLLRDLADRGVLGRLAGLDVALGQRPQQAAAPVGAADEDRKSTRLNSSHANISYAVFCLKKKKKQSFDIRIQH